MPVLYVQIMCIPLAHLFTPTHLLFYCEHTQFKARPSHLNPYSSAQYTVHAKQTFGGTDK